MSEFIFTITSAEPSDAAIPPTVLLTGHKCLEFLTTIIVLKHPDEAGVTRGILPIDCTFVTITAAHDQFEELREKALAGTANQLRVEYHVLNNRRRVTLIDTLTDARFRALLLEVEEISDKVGAGFTKVAQKLDRINETLLDRLPPPQGDSLSPTSDSMSEALATAEQSSSEGTHNNSGDDASSRLI
jgi:hypothetical protein